MIAGKEKFKCPECREEYDVSEKGVKRFPDNRWIEDLLIRKMTFECLEHSLPLHFFCNNAECQEQICSACAIVEHKDHNIMKLKDKAVTVKEEMSKTKDNVREISLELGAHLDRINKELEDVKTTSSRNCDAVEERRKELHEKIKQLQEKVQEEMERQKIELSQNETESK